MKILQRYITSGLLWTTVLSLFVLVALFSFFSLVDQLEESGRGNYGVLQAVTYVLLTTPRLAYELFPIAAMIGAMAVLGLLAQNSELAIIRTSGVSRPQLALLFARGGLLLVIFAVVIGEGLAPVSEEKAQHMRSVALTKQITLKSRHGFWSRDGNSFVNIRKVLPGNQVEQIYIFEFDEQNHLRSSIYARRASYEQNQWRLENIQQTLIEGDGVRRRTFKQAAWESLLNPEMINLVIVQPQYLSVFGLVQYIHYLQENAQSSRRYEQALWIKLVRPLSIIAMMVLAVPLVRGHVRTTPIGQRVFIGALIGITFHIINQASGNLGLVYEIPPVLSAGLPTLLLACIITWLLQRN